jgi:hypothetical protein
VRSHRHNSFVNKVSIQSSPFLFLLHIYYLIFWDKSQELFLLFAFLFFVFFPFLYIYIISYFKAKVKKNFFFLTNFFLLLSLSFIYILSHKTGSKSRKI